MRVADGLRFPKVLYCEHNKQIIRPLLSVSVVRLLTTSNKKINVCMEVFHPPKALTERRVM